MAEIILAYDRLDDIRALFSEYMQMLVSINPEFRLYLDIQHYDEEEKDPSGKYALPDGRLYLALVDGFPAGCIALHRLDSISGELYRKLGFTETAPYNDGPEDRTIFMKLSLLG